MASTTPQRPRVPKRPAPPARPSREELLARSIDRNLTREEREAALEQLAKLSKPAVNDRAARRAHRAEAERLAKLDDQRKGDWRATE